MSKYKAFRSTRRSGITLLELLVVMSIISVLLALIVPAIQSARESARRLSCANNLRNCAFAVLSAAETHRRFPAAALWGAIGPDKEHVGPVRNWVVTILPLLDRRDLSDRWDAALFASDPSNQTVAEIHIASLVCPSDDSVTGGGDISYAINGGIGESDLVDGVQDCIVDPFGAPLDLNGNGLVCIGSEVSDGQPSDREVFKSLGLFFNENWNFEATPGYRGTVRYHTAASVQDGCSNTLLITENVLTGASADSNWASCDSRRTKVYFSNDVCRNNVCSRGSVSIGLANSAEAGINRGLGRQEGQAPWPNSHHADGVNAAFADGRVQFLNESIDGAVYFALFTTQSVRLSAETAFGSEPLSHEF